MYITEDKGLRCLNRIRWRISLGLILIGLSIVIYFVQYLFFHNSHNIFVDFLSALAFMPLQVLFVTLILETLLNERERDALKKKLNMVIGVFYSEVGRELLRLLAQSDPDNSAFREKLLKDNEWSNKDFLRFREWLGQYGYNLKMEGGELVTIKDFILSKRNFMLRLLENPNLLEHETFSEILWAVFHLGEELGARENLNQLNQTDLEHLVNDVRRVYNWLILDWLEYMKHLRDHYPFLFSFAVRTNPFDPDSRVEFE